MADATNEATLQVGGDAVAIKRRRSSGVITTRILGRETANGREVIYLDSLIHQGTEETLGEWEATGAVSSILTRACCPSSALPPAA